MANWIPMKHELTIAGRPVWLVSADVKYSDYEPATLTAVIRPQVDGWELARHATENRTTFEFGGLQWVAWSAQVGADVHWRTTLSGEVTDQLAGPVEMVITLSCWPVR